VIGVLHITRRAFGARPARPDETNAGTLAERQDWRLLGVGLVVIDVCLLGVALFIAELIRLRVDDLSDLGSLTPGHHLLASALVLPGLLVLLRVHHLYDFDAILVGTREYAHIAHAVTYGVFVAIGTSYFASHSQFISRSWLLLVWVLCISLLSVGRFAARRVVRALRRRGHLRTRVIVVGASNTGVAIAQQLRDAPDDGFDVVGFLDEYVPLGQTLLDDIAVVGRPDDLLHDQAVWMADEYVLVPQALPHERQEAISLLMASRSRPVLRMAISPTEMLTHGVRIAERANLPLVSVRQARLSGVESIVKRLFDAVGASLTLAVLAVPLLVVLVRASLRGCHPLFRYQSIVGILGKPGGLWLLDPSVAGWPPLRGAPALIAVLLARLSLVGPRPVVCASRDHSSQMAGLTAVRPGLTGPWRLSGPDASLHEQSLRDLSYVHSYSIWEDVRILWISVVRVLGGGHLPSLVGRWETTTTVQSLPIVSGNVETTRHQSLLDPSRSPSSS
jgi:lipopolysaccharide/colanic/teichoic acid biosynthesis glycosyltransferase